MAFDFANFQDTYGYGIHSLSMLIYGPTKVGKTSLALTTDAPANTIILGAEAGLLPLRGAHLRYYEMPDMATLFGALAALEARGREGKLKGRWVILDSISEIAERSVAALKKTVKDPRQAYGETQELAMEAMRRFRELPCHTVFIAKQEQLQDDEGRMLFGPSLPGKSLGPKVGYQFELVMAYRAERTPQGVYRYLQTEQDGRYQAGDRSGVLSPREEPHLGAIVAKIMASMPAPTPPPEAPLPEANPQQPPTPETTA